jgi:NAD(P)-dependent dehydrogenase (short-subunit alcohol dehydrogenase family)
MVNVKLIVLSLIFVVLVYFHQQWKSGTYVPSSLLQTNLKGKTILITGANTGIGLETSIQLAKLGAKIILGCRNDDKATAALKHIKDSSKNDQIFYPISLDLGSFKSIRKFVDVIHANGEKVDILINNAGIMSCPHALTADGFEIQFGTNHLGHYLLTKLILEEKKMMKKGGRIINVSSRAHTRTDNFEVLDNIESPNTNLTEMTLYAQSKLANVMYTHELQRRYGEMGIVAYSLHPGVVDTELARHFNPTLQRIGKVIAPFLLKTAFEGAQTSIFAALVDPNEVPSGSYLADCVVNKENPLAYVKCLQKELWEVSEKAIASKSF